MRAAKLGVKLVEHYGISPRKALEALIEMDPDKAAELMAAGIKDPDERKRAEMKFKKEVQGMIQTQAKEVDEPEEGDDEPHKEPDGDEPEEEDDEPSVSAKHAEGEPDGDEEEDPEDPEEEDDDPEEEDDPEDPEEDDDSDKDDKKSEKMKFYHPKKRK